jgi:hypothetical protein
MLNIVIALIPAPTQLSCWKARLNKLEIELWYLHKHNLQYNVRLYIQKIYFRKI